MIPISTFNLMVAVDLVLIIYSVIDHENRLYANIVTTFLSGLLAAFLGYAINTEAVYDDLGGVLTVVASPSIGYFLYFVSTIMFFYTALMLYEVIDNAFANKREQEQMKLEEE